MLSPIYTPILYCDLCLTTQKSQFAKHKFGERERERDEEEIHVHSREEQRSGLVGA